MPPNLFTPSQKDAICAFLQAMDPHGSMNQERWGIRFDGWMTYEQLLALAPLLIAMALETTAPQGESGGWLRDPWWPVAQRKDVSWLP